MFIQSLASRIANAPKIAFNLVGLGLRQIFPKQLKYAAYDALTKKGEENAKRAFRFQGKRLATVNLKIMAAGISSKYDVLITQINQKVD